MSDQAHTEQGAEQESQSAPIGQKVDILPASHWAAVEVSDDDTESVLGPDEFSSTASVTSSILRYRTIQGRAYHSEKGNAQYWASNDEKQNAILDILHHAITLSMDDKLYLAPIKSDIQKAVDIGTGTGIWAIDFADEFPDAEIIGTDISRIQPSWVPPNVKFEIEDCTSEWTFPPDSIDYIHIRWLLGSIPDWTELFTQAYRCLKPGGYVESFEPGATIESDDGTVTESSAMGQWGKLFIEAGKKFGRPFTVLSDSLQRKGLEGAGFINIEESGFKMPLGAWPRDPKQQEIGRYQQLIIEHDAEGTMLFAAGTQGWTKEEVKLYLSHFRREIRDSNNHGYYRQKVVWAQKPQ